MSFALDPSSNNSYDQALENGETWTGVWERVAPYNTITVAMKTDQSGSLTIEFSPDGVNADSTLTYPVQAGVNEFHRLSATRLYFRVSFENDSGSNQTYFRLQTLKGDHPVLTSNLNSTVSQDADAIITRTIDSEIGISGGLYAGYSIVNKFGLNSAVSTADVPEDVWEGGGAYTGWATSAETLNIVSSSTNDVMTSGTGAWQIRVVGLDSNYEVQSETVNLNGTNTVTTTASFIRVHTASILSAGSGGVNAGIITVNQSTTTSNIFLKMQSGRNQTNSSSYTIPAGYTGYMRYLHSACSKTQSVAIQGHIWTRTFGQVFRSRRPFFISDTYRVDDYIYGGLVFSEKSDIIIRILSCSANNVPINAGYDLVLVKN